jgi:hypothetical protein
MNFLSKKNLFKNTTLETLEQLEKKNVKSGILDRNCLHIEKYISATTA